MKYLGNPFEGAERWFVLIPERTMSIQNMEIKITELQSWIPFWQDLAPIISE